MKQWSVLVVLALSACALAQQSPDQFFSRVNLTDNNNFNGQEVHYEWESYDGWYNNPAHPEWGASDMPMERKTPIAYPDGVYEIAGQDRPNVLVIANLSQNGLTGLGSNTRSTFFLYFGQQVVEEVLDAQRAGCIPEYENILVPKCHPLYDPECRGDRFIPFLRNRYDFRTGYSPNNPRMQLNEITPWFDGGLMYGPFKAWTDVIRSFSNGELAANDNALNIADQYPASNGPVGLPYANPPPPVNNTLFRVNRFWLIGNPRGNENPFLLTMGVFWFRVHNYWARRLRYFYEQNNATMNLPEEWETDEWLFNRARVFTIATHQHIVYSEWLPVFLEGKYRRENSTFPYASTPGYSLYFGRSGYNPAINPQVAHVFQSAAMRFGHTMVTPGIWRRTGGGGERCAFGPTMSPDFANFTNSYLQSIGATQRFASIDELYNFFCNTPEAQRTATQNDSNIQRLLCNNPFYTNPYFNGTEQDMYDTAHEVYFAPRTCNQFWNPQVPIMATNVDSMYMGMISQRCEREDTIITPDLRGKVFGPLDFTRRDLMAQNMQRARDHGLPDFNRARIAYGLEPKLSFEDLNPNYGTDPQVTASIERLREVYNNDITKCDIWACGLAETTVDDGPGELFSEVLFDQFMRIRHADRFWYENYRDNKLFDENEFQMINTLTMKQLLIAVTNNITENNIQDQPFMVSTDINHCPQPFQLSELYMDECSALSNFDYYTESYWQVPFTWAVVFIYIGIVIFIMVVIAAMNQSRRSKILSGGHAPRVKKIDGTDLTDNSGDVVIVTEERTGASGKECRSISFKLGSDRQPKVLRFYSGGIIYRSVDLRNQTKITFQKPFDNQYYFAIKIKNEYDSLVRCLTYHDRELVIQKLSDYFKELGIETETRESKLKDIRNQMFTKRDRQILLENFFKSVFNEAKSRERYETRTDILDTELTREEFAEAMSMKPDSTFIEQMFQLVDVDGNGFISFREFVDMTVIFSKGSPDEKLDLMFRMYDVDGNGQLNREEFKKMLKSMMELVNASVTPDQMDKLVDNMFESAGFQNKEFLTSKDFQVLMRDHKEELSNAKLNVAGVDTSGLEVTSKKEEAEGGAAPSRYKARETATARARRTIIHAYRKDERPRTAPAQSSVQITTQRRTITSTGFGRKVAVFLRWVENYRLHIFYLSVFFLVTAGIFIERAYYYSVEREFGGLRRIAGYGVTVTRGAASAMMWTYSVLLITMARNFITYLRETIFNYYIPFDTYISFHKIVALTGLFFTIMHCVGHGINFYHISTQTANDLTCIFREVYHRSHVLPKFFYWLFLTVTGFSAFVLTLVTIVMFVFAVQYSRRYAFTAFWFTHHWYVVFYILMFLHGSGRLVQDPLFGNFFLGPGIIFAIDRIISVSRKKVQASVIRADILPSGVTGIYFQRPVTFDYRAGQWMSIACAAQNPGEFHPFTISSAPHEENLSLHIRSVGPWTYNFREIFSKCNNQKIPYPKLYLDGPFGEGHQDWFRYDVSVLVGGGIGVTPFASILKELVHRFNIGARVQCKKVYFIWVTRTQRQYEWLTEIIREVEDADKTGILDVHIFVTQFFDKFDLRTSMLYIAERHFQRVSGRSLFTGLRAVTHFGRPDFNTFFDSLQEEHIVLPKIGVFSCGPPGMTNGVEAACAATNRFEGPAFIHHYENF